MAKLGKTLLKTDHYSYMKYERKISKHFFADNKKRTSKYNLQPCGERREIGIQVKIDSELIKIIGIQTKFQESFSQIISLDNQIFHIQKFQRHLHKKRSEHNYQLFFKIFKSRDLCSSCGYVPCTCHRCCQLDARIRSSRSTVHWRRWCPRSTGCQ